MATDFNAVFNNLLPLLLQAKQQRIANERRDKQLQLQARQQATAGRQRERQLDLTEENAEKQLKQKERHYLGNTYDGLTWREKKVWLESGSPIPSGVNPIGELRMINQNIQIEDDEQQLKIDTQETRKQLLNLGLRNEQSEADIIKPVFKTSLDRQRFGSLEANQTLIDRELLIPGIDKKRRTELIGQREAVRSEMEKFFPEGTFVDDTLTLFEGGDIDLDIVPKVKTQAQVQAALSRFVKSVGLGKGEEPKPFFTPKGRRLLGLEENNKSKSFLTPKGQDILDRFKSFF